MSWHTDPDAVKREIERLSGENIALQTLLFSLMHALVSNGGLPNSDAERVFDAASSFLEGQAIRLGRKASPEQTLTALRVVEQLRREFLA